MSCARWVGGSAAVLLALGACRAEPARDVNARAAATASNSAPLSSTVHVDTAWPATPLGAAARRGHALLAHTPDSLPRYAPSALRCLNCHLEDGARRNGLLLVGAYARFPQFRARSGRVDMLADRINDCFQRSLNGRALPMDGPEMRDIVAYFAWISRGIGVFDSVRGQGLPPMSPLAPDTVRGRALYASACVRCHAANGAGGAGVPPLWGPRSFNIGAGMARLRTAASFIRYNMPFDSAGLLTDQQAFDIAAYVISRPRPDFPGKEKDWPHGDPPPDVAYSTMAASLKSAPARSTPTRAP